MRIAETCIAAALALSFGMAAPVTAAPLFTKSAPVEAENSNVILAHTKRNRHMRGHMHTHHGQHGIYNGYRGRRHHVHGWRHHNGWWFPPAAFAMGAFFGHALNDNRRVIYYRDRLPQEHYYWCDGRYKTYRWSDNTYVPRVGYRAECRSPYWP